MSIISKAKTHTVTVKARFIVQAHTTEAARVAAMGRIFELAAACPGVSFEIADIMPDTYGMARNEKSEG